MASGEQRAKKSNFATESGPTGAVLMQVADDELLYNDNDNEYDWPTQGKTQATADAIDTCGDTTADNDGEPDGPDGGKENVAVIVRCRPLRGSAELTKANQDKTVVDVDEPTKCVQVHERQFYFDQVFGPQSNNETVYMKSVRRLVEGAFKGYNCTIFLYGQTGTGKTYTHSSLTLSSFEHLFSLIGDSNTRERFLIRASYYELYNEDIRDLLANSGKPLELRESKLRGVYIKDLSCFLVNNLKELAKLKRVGDKRRATAATRMNEHSSRSHSIFSITIETVSDASASSDTSTRPAPTSAGRRATPAPVREAVRLGRLHLIDLAGSERQSKSGSTGARLKEASQINLSLTSLSLVIRALTDKNSNHVPYRNSKLTRLLSSSLGGNSKTLLIACISPAFLHLDETLNTLRFASRTKRIKNTAKINEDPKDALLRKYRRQIEELRHKLQARQCGVVANAPESDDALQRRANELIDSTDGCSAELAADGADNEQLLQQLRFLKAKIMIGGENLLEKAEMHDRLLEASRQELEEKQRQERALKLKLETKRKAIEQVAQSRDTLESQRADLNDKLKRALSLYRRSKDELRDLTGEHEQLKAGLLQTIRATSKEIKYADCVIEDFIPAEQLELINAYAQYDDESHEWQIKYIALSGNNIDQTKRLTSERHSSAAAECRNELNGHQKQHQSVERRRASANCKSGDKQSRLTDDGDAARLDPFVCI